MAEPMYFNLEVSGVSEEDASAIHAALVEMGLASVRGAGDGLRPLSGNYLYLEGTLHFPEKLEQKWPDAREDLRQLSRRFPGRLFELTASGCPEDECVLYARDGLTCVIEPYRVWPEFDESMLA